MSAVVNRSQENPDTLWRMYRDGHDAACVLERTPVGLQGQFLLDGRMLAGHQFTSYAQLLMWAADKCADLRSRGWQTRQRQANHGSTRGPLADEAATNVKPSKRAAVRYVRSSSLRTYA